MHLLFKVIHPKYYKNWLYTLAETIDWIFLTYFDQKKYTLKPKLDSTLAKLQINSVLHWVFIVLGIFNFANIGNSTLIWPFYVSLKLRGFFADYKLTDAFNDPL